MGGRWIVSLVQMRKDGKTYKVARRMLTMNVTETRMFQEKPEAQKQFKEWQAR